MNENENKDLQVTTTEVIANEEAVTEMETTVEEEASTKKSPGEFWAKATVFGKKVADNVQKNAVALSEKAKADNYQRRLKKYHPITLKEYKSKKFNIPNVIKIVDDAETRNIDVCEDAIGRLVNEKGVEIFYMNDEFIQSCGLHFVPAPVCDAIYHVDNFDRTRFIRTDAIFAKALEEKLAELEHIAFCLGARRCSIEIIENDSEVSSKNAGSSSATTRKAKAEDGQKEQSISAQTDLKKENERQSRRNNRGKIATDFAENSAPHPPRLKWFAHNDNVRNLIEMRLSKTGSVRSKTLELSGTSSASMTQKTAIAIDYEMTKMGIKGNGSSSIERQAQIEKNSNLIFEVIFEE